jgi:hypothetical protein
MSFLFRIDVSKNAQLANVMPKPLKCNIMEPFSKRFSLVKLKAGSNFNRRHPDSIGIPRIEI